MTHGLRGFCPPSESQLWKLNCTNIMGFRSTLSQVSILFRSAHWAILFAFDVYEGVTPAVYGVGAEDLPS